MVASVLRINPQRSSSVGKSWSDFITVKPRTSSTTKINKCYDLNIHLSVATFVFKYLVCIVWSACVGGGGTHVKGMLAHWVICSLQVLEKVKQGKSSSPSEVIFFFISSWSKQTDEHNPSTLTRMTSYTITAKCFYMSKPEESPPDCCLIGT